MKHLLLILFFIATYHLHAQDSLEQKNWIITGYVKDLPYARFDKKFDNAYFTNLIHNRVNIRWNPRGSISGRLEVRNRFYIGDDVKLIPGFKDQLKTADAFADLSVTALQGKSTVFHSNVERLWLEYDKGKWNVRAGRQRINWGITNTWNPNDLFNTYNFLDFDYEERPGSDAVRIHRSFSGDSHMEFAIAGTNDRPVTAIKYSTNYKGYDLQWIGGYYRRSFTAGFGWAGNIADAGFKGEAQYYSGKDDSLSSVNMTVEADYMFRKGWYVSFAALFNENGAHAPPGDWSKLNFQVSPRNLMPARWSFLGVVSKEFTPLLNGGMNVVYSPEVNMLILFPTIKYNINTNVDLDFIWQSFFAEIKNFQAVSHAGYLRLRWSF